MRCNICETVVLADEKSLDLMDHIKSNHKEVYDLHKENPEATVGFRIEFLHLNVLDDSADPKNQPVIIGEVCEATTEEIVKQDTEKEDHNIISTPKTAKKKRRESESRKKSWVWKYFHRISDVIYRCTLCEAILSIKGCNTNNMNRHIRSKHLNIFQAEMMEKKIIDLDAGVEIDQHSIQEEISTEFESYETKEKRQLNRRSWIWHYFDRISSTLAQCKLCQRNICHGGNATGNMNRHLKMLHNKTGQDNTWVWKVFDRSDKDYNTCKICQYKCSKDIDMNMTCILNHLKLEHGVVSGDQIIT